MGLSEEMKCECTEVFYITSKSAGCRNARYFELQDARKALQNIARDRRKRFGITSVEIYTYYGKDGKFDHRETYERWVDE